MKKLSFMVLAFVFGIIIQANAQSAQTPDFFVGKWEMGILGTPNGDAVLPVEFTLKEGKLVGDITNPEDPTGPKIPTSSIEIGENKLVIFFSMAGYDLNIDFAKSDDDNFKGKLMDMFESYLKRKK